MANYTIDSSTTHREMLQSGIFLRDYLFDWVVITIYVFARLLPENLMEDQKLAQTVGGLLNALTAKYLDPYYVGHVNPYR